MTFKEASFSSTLSPSKKKKKKKSPETRKDTDTLESSSPKELYRHSQY